MIPSKSIKQRYRPCVEGLDCRKLLSAGPLTLGAQVFVQATAPSSSQVQLQGVIPDGTGKAIFIVTS
jgi:hypothetical protein